MEKRGTLEYRCLRAPANWILVHGFLELEWGMFHNRRRVLWCPEEEYARYRKVEDNKKYIEAERVERLIDSMKVWCQEMPVVMPLGKRCAVCLTFDFDAISLWLEPSGVPSPSKLSRGEFGARCGVPRILKLLDKYDIKSTFFVPGHTADTYPEVVKEIHEKGHEIAHHGYAHERAVELELEDELAILKKGIESISRITGERPLGYRSPGFNMSPNTIKLLIDHGFVYDSSMTGEDFRPYKCRLGDVASMTEAFRFGEETALLEIPAYWSLDDFPIFEFVLRPITLPGLAHPSRVLEIWLGDFDYMYENVIGGVYDLILHPQVIGRGHRMVMLEKIIRHIRGRPRVWFARMIDIAKAWKDQEFNPTS